MMEMKYLSRGFACDDCSKLVNEKNCLHYQDLLVCDKCAIKRGAKPVDDDRWELSPSFNETKPFSHHSIL